MYYFVLKLRLVLNLYIQAELFTAAEVDDVAEFERIHSVLCNQALALDASSRVDCVGSTTLSR